jgi:PAS domain S-box-containing protein
MRILIAEDEPTNRLLLEVSVRKWGHEPLVAVDGDEAWALLDAPDAPSLVLLDWMMPGMDGVEICRRLRASDEPRLIYVIMVTTNAQDADIIEGLEAGADDYVTKPFDPQELRARVDVGIRMVELHQRLMEREARLAVANARLAEQARFRATVEGMTDGIVTADADWRITYANRSAELLLDLLDGAYYGRPLEEALNRFELSVDPASLRSGTEAGTDLEIARTGAGVKLWIDGRLTRLRDEAGELSDVVLTLRDATDRVNASDREMRFMNSISHKLRTPLTIIGGSLEVMAGLPCESAQGTWDRLLTIGRRQVRRLDETIARVLQFRELSQEELVAEPPSAELPQLIESVEETLRERYPDEELEFATEVSPGAERTSLPADDLRLMIDELADNAVKFAERRPIEVRVTAERGEDGALRLSIADNGPGIPHEFLDRVFEGYLQIEEHATGQVRGVGLGLRIVRQVAEAHGGTVTVASKMGEGTAVTIIIPAGSA